MSVGYEFEFEFGSIVFCFLDMVVVDNLIY